MDFKELVDHLGLESADYCGWSMGAAILWGYIDLFGTKGIRKVAFVDEPISIYAHEKWSEQERREAGAMTTSPEQLAASLTASTNDSLLDTRSNQGSPYFVNSESFATSFITNDPGTVGLVLSCTITWSTIGAMWSDARLTCRQRSSVAN
jgi:non-heme chloroperoxidase